MSDETLIAEYPEEYAYIESRRRILTSEAEQSGSRTPGSVTAAPTTTPTPTPVSAKPANLVGLALSGGGIRSASFSLGALQAMVQSGVYDQLDYMSSVSGGGYLTGWLQAHLGARSSVWKDDDGYTVHADSPSELFDNHGEFVEHLRTHSGFLNTGGWFPLSTMVGEWLIRWPPHIIMDSLLNIRGQDRWYHIMPIYEDRIQQTYFRGTPPPKQPALPLAELPLTEINDRRHADRTPYLILNGFLTNRGASQIGAPQSDDSKWNFEFTRDFVGSDATGYVDTRGFGLGVWRVRRDNDGKPLAMVAKADSPDTSPFRLSQAVAASGAAFDSLSVANAYLDYPVAREAAEAVGSGLFNLYLGLEVPNFARRGKADGWDRLRDGVYMETFQRVPSLVTPRASWLYISDGGSYENLGVLSLLRRGVSCVIALDATADLSRQYEDLKTLRNRVENDLHMTWLTQLPAPQSDTNVAYRFVIGDANKEPRAVILYLKASADPTRWHLQEARGLRRIKRLENAELYNARLLFQSLRDAVVADPSLHPTQTQDLFKQERELLDRIYDYYEAVNADVSSQATTDAQRNASRRDVLAGIGKGEQNLIGVGAGRSNLSRPTPIMPTPGSGNDLLATERAQVTPNPTALEEMGELYRAQVQAYQSPLRSPTPTPTPGQTEKTARPWSQSQTRLEKKIDEINAAMRPLFAGHITFAQHATMSWEAFDNMHQQISKRLSDTISKRDRWAKEDAEWRRYVNEVNAFASSASSFPDDSTLKQTYEWERFEAYRMLGYLTVQTYLDPFDLPTQSAAPDWCRRATDAWPFNKALPTIAGSN